MAGQPPQILLRRDVAHSRLFRIEELELRFSNGEVRHFERLASSSRGAVLIVALADRDTVLLIREYAAAVERYELGLPKGRIDGDETLEQAACRELMEETGYGAHTVRHLHTLTLAPAYFSHLTHVMLAEDLYPQRLAGDEPEPIEVVPWSLAELDALVRSGACSEARSLAALYMVRDLVQTKETE
ncbi:MAG: ADP compounds hydrolase NudE [Gammaproteobacteria bacterium]|nr:ADP compounds hydrolase NudE [Gammaproteobacteria bacterium]